MRLEDLKIRFKHLVRLRRSLRRLKVINFYQEFKHTPCLSLKYILLKQNQETSTFTIHYVHIQTSEVL